jgi:hypothetical protein
MAAQGIAVTDKVVTQLMQGRLSADKQCWLIPQPAPIPQAPLG